MKLSYRILIGILATILGVWLILNADYNQQETTTPHQTPPTACAEDDPCWDCTNMGNLICGPTSTVDLPGKIGNHTP